MLETQFALENPILATIITLAFLGVMGFIAWLFYKFIYGLFFG